MVPRLLCNASSCFITCPSSTLAAGARGMTGAGTAAGAAGAGGAGAGAGSTVGRERKKIQISACGVAAIE